MKVWRLLITPPARGAWNMAVDEAILEAVSRGGSLPTLRLYAWEPACLSLGYAQPLTDVDIPHLQARGWEMVRRPTGGRAVLHTDEITYSVIAPLNEPRVAGTVLESYSRLAAALVEALRLLSLPVEVQERADPVPRAGTGTTTREPGLPRTSSKTPNPVCFEVPSTSEITVGGKKLVGSAQARRKEGILQHGSLPLTGDLTRILQVLVFSDEEARTRASRHLLERATTVETALGRVVSWNEAAQAYIAAFRSVLALDLQPGKLTPEEDARAGELSATKYAHPEGTQKQKS
ncbi:MAG: lipoate--protein ligase family protein [Candidatus Atribacteria bacterium]|nr:lipoate--protein ligase family protein [Candidatus Atribacteria bacterium]